MDDSHRPRQKRTRALTVALAASLGVHLAALPFLRVAALARTTPPPSVIRLDPAKAPKPFVPPPPTPRPTHPPIARATKPTVLRPRTVAIEPPRAHTQTARALVEPPTARHRTSGVTVAVGDPTGDAPGGARSVAATGAPIDETPSALPTRDATASPIESSCPAAAHEARVVDAMTPDRPAVAAQEGAFGRVEVRVDLSLAGSVLLASVYKSSGNAALDGVAVEAARRSTYVAASDGCRSIAGSYVFVVDFSE